MLLPFEASRWIIWLPDQGQSAQEAKKEITNLFVSLLNAKYPKKKIVNSHFSFFPTTKDEIVFSIGEPKKGKAPSSLGGYDAFVWGVTNKTLADRGDGALFINIPECNFGIAGLSQDQQKARECLLSLTKDLPPYIYYYSPRITRGFVDTYTLNRYGKPGRESADIHGAEYPIVMNQGKVYFFIEPAINQDKKQG
ncbi:hypothetical protein CI610_02458 [invertebrate metagenome]|uniref:Uncharacterized protein n=1 Tax=invertebrate metagenome TaxID=1711999 RepID=A0A2H9T5U5_9ZZZZ